MKEVEQTIHTVPGGNCFAACLASILELPIEEVPNFNAATAGENWCERVNEWLAPRNLHLQGWLHSDESDPRIFRGFSICTVGYADQGDDGHCVVAYDGKIVWNPSPLRDTKQHNRIIDWCTFQVVDPSRPIN